MGTQDSLGEAEQFVDDHGLSIDMLWDESLRSWQELGVTGQPYVVVFSADGEVIGGGGFNEDQILSAI